MMIQTFVILDDGRVLQTDVASSVAKGDTIILDMVAYVIDEKGYILLGKQNGMFLILAEKEGKEIAPSGRYDWLEAARTI